MAPRLGARLTRLGAIAAAAGLLAVAALPPTSPRARAVEPRGTQDTSRDVTDVLGANAACLVCHLTFVKEELARRHQLHGVACTKCHGPSVAHANDEHVGATKPDIIHPRAKIDAGCASCHEDHDVPARKVVERFLERKLPAKTAAVCTDCHGRHRIERAVEPDDPKQPGAP